MREAGLGSGAGLGSEALRRAQAGVAVYPRAPSVPSVSARCPSQQRMYSLLRKRRSHSKCGLGRATLFKPAGAAVEVCDRGSQKADVGASIVASFGPSKAPARPPASLPVSVLCRPRAKSRRGKVARAIQRNHRRVSCGCGCIVLSEVVRGYNGPACRGVRTAVAVVLALSPLVPRARTGVSPALPWNALGCVGAGAPALSTAGRSM